MFNFVVHLQKANNTPLHKSVACQISDLVTGMAGAKSGMGDVLRQSQKVTAGDYMTNMGNMNGNHGLNARYEYVERDHQVQMNLDVLAASGTMCGRKMTNPPPLVQARQKSEKQRSEGFMC